MVMHIVTERCFLACEKVTYIKLEEEPKKATPNCKAKRGRPRKIEPECNYVITIGYIPSSTVNYKRDIEECLVLILGSKEKAFSLYAEIVREVQEQHPNEAYLDRLVSKMLGGGEFKLQEV
jgi:hypothetical protein